MKRKIAKRFNTERWRRKDNIIWMIQSEGLGGDAKPRSHGDKLLNYPGTTYPNSSRLKFELIAPVSSAGCKHLPAAFRSPNIIIRVQRCRGRSCRRRLFASPLPVWAADEEEQPHSRDGCHYASGIFNVKAIHILWSRLRIQSGLYLPPDDRRVLQNFCFPVTIH